MDQQAPNGTAALSACVENEIQAWAAAITGAWADAAKHAHEVARIAGTGGPATKGYRAFWTYLEAVWADQAADLIGDAAGRTAAQGLVRLAEQIMGLGSWVRQMTPFPAMQRSELSALDANAVNAVAAVLDAGVNQGKVRRRIGEIHAAWVNAIPANTNRH